MQFGKGTTLIKRLCILMPIHRPRVRRHLGGVLRLSQHTEHVARLEVVPGQVGKQASCGYMTSYHGQALSPWLVIKVLPLQKGEGRHVLRAKAKPSVCPGGSCWCWCLALGSAFQTGLQATAQGVTLSRPTPKSM